MNSIAFFLWGLERVSWISVNEVSGYFIGIVLAPTLIVTCIVLIMSFFLSGSPRVYLSLGGFTLLFALSAILALSTYIVEYTPQMHELIRTFIVSIGFENLIENTSNYNPNPGSTYSEYGTFFINLWLRLSYFGTWISLIYIFYHVNNSNQPSLENTSTDTFIQ